MARSNFTKAKLWMPNSNQNRDDKTIELYWVDTACKQEASIALQLKRVANQSTDFCPEGWDQPLEDYFRGKIIVEIDESSLLDHIFNCRHCSDHIVFLELICDACGNKESVHDKFQEKINKCIAQAGGYW